MDEFLGIIDFEKGILVLLFKKSWEQEVIPGITTELKGRDLTSFIERRYNVTQEIFDEFVLEEDKVKLFNNKIKELELPHESTDK